MRLAGGLTWKELADRLDAPANRPISVLVLSCTNQDALQALFGDDVTACLGKRVQLEPTPMRVAGRERLTAVT